MHATRAVVAAVALLIRLTVAVAVAVERHQVVVVLAVGNIK